MAGHFGHAVLEAYKAVDRRVALQSDLKGTGKDLMARALNEGSGPIDLSHERGQSGREREGFRFLAMGSMIGIRNPKSHELLRPMSPARALDYLSVASLILRRLDDALILRRGLTDDIARKTVSRIEDELPGCVQSRLEGVVGYPSSHVPAVAVYCLRSDNRRFSYVTRVSSRGPGEKPRFVVESARPGKYVVFAKRSLKSDRVGAEQYGGYTKYVLGGLGQGQADHSLVSVEVAPGEVVSTIDVADWYGFEPGGIYGATELFGYQVDAL